MKFFKIIIFTFFVGVASSLTICGGNGIAGGLVGEVATGMANSDGKPSDSAPYLAQIAYLEGKITILESRISILEQAVGKLKKQ